MPRDCGVWWLQRRAPRSTLAREKWRGRCYRRVVGGDPDASGDEADDKGGLGQPQNQAHRSGEGGATRDSLR